MFNAGELFEHVSNLKKSKGFVSNAFFSANSMTRIAHEKASCLLSSAGAAAIINDDNGVSRLYFYLASLDSMGELEDLIRTSKTRPLAADCVGRAGRLEELTDRLCAVGFKPYASLSRWRSEQIMITPSPSSNTFRAAEEDDCDVILRILRGSFDPLVSHLPSREKLLALIKEKLVFCAYNSGEILAVVCLEKQGKLKVYSYQNVVREEYRRAGLGSSLLQFALSQFRDCTQYTAWIEDGNLPSRRMHKALGMSPDGLKDHVLIYE